MAPGVARLDHKDEETAYFGQKPFATARRRVAAGADGAATIPGLSAEKSGAQVEQETLQACLKRNPENQAYCRCYANEMGNRYAEKAKAGEVSVQERGQIAVQSALACKQLNKKD